MSTQRYGDTATQTSKGLQRSIVTWSSQVARCVRLAPPPHVEGKDEAFTVAEAVNECCREDVTDSQLHALK